MPEIFLNPKFWIIANMGFEALLRNLFLELDGKSEEELDEIIVKNRAEINVIMAEARKK